MFYGRSRRVIQFTSSALTNQGINFGGRVESSLILLIMQQNRNELEGRGRVVGFGKSGNGCPKFWCALDYRFDG
jgi:hypothetical protein